MSPTGHQRSTQAGARNPRLKKTHPGFQLPGLCKRREKDLPCWELKGNFWRGTLISFLCPNTLTPFASRHFQSLAPFVGFRDKRTDLADSSTLFSESGSRGLCGDWHRGICSVVHLPVSAWLFAVRSGLSVQGPLHPLQGPMHTIVLSGHGDCSQTTGEAPYFPSPGGSSATLRIWIFAFSKSPQERSACGA